MARLSGQSPDGSLVEIIELPDHPWFLVANSIPNSSLVPTGLIPLPHSWGRHCSVAEADRSTRPRSGCQPPLMSWTFGQAPLLIAGPCVAESDDVMVRVAEEWSDSPGEPAGASGEFR
jgi:hypothetical protein